MKYVAYLIPHEPTSQKAVMLSSDRGSQQALALSRFQSTHPNLLKTYTEVYPTRHRLAWRELEKAVDYCLKHDAHLVIPEIRNYTHHKGFSEILELFIEGSNKKAKALEIMCLDQPLVTRESLPTLIAYERQHTRHHSQLIKEGLEHAQKPSGNPNAAEEIQRIHRHKTDNANAFALLMMPIIAHLQSLGLSQRKMIHELNTHGFQAPEGGPWGLSQLQKLLARIRLSKAALELESTLLAFDKAKLSTEAIAFALNTQKIPVPTNSSLWDSEAVTELRERLKEIQNLIVLNELILELSPLFSASTPATLSEHEFREQLEALGLNLQENHTHDIKHSRKLNYE